MNISHHEFGFAHLKLAAVGGLGFKLREYALGGAWNDAIKLI